MRVLITIISTVLITGLAGKSFIFPPETGLYIDSTALQLQPHEITSQSPVTFALITDLHVNPGSESDSALNRIVDEINKSDAEFTVVSGDLTNTGSDSELFAVKRALDKLVLPCYVLPGNHETNWSESAGLTFNKLWGNDRFLFNHKGFLFIGFNTGPFMKMGDGHIKQEDINWLKRQLSKHNPASETLISFSHYPLADGLDNWFNGTDLLKASACRLSFCGHGHKLALLNFDGIPGIMGRSVILGKSAVPGYNIVKLRNDSVLVYNKEVSKVVSEPVIRLNYLRPDTLKTIAISPRPDYSINQLYKNRIVLAEWTDTASIFTGPCLVNDSTLIYGNSLGWIKAINIITKKTIWQKQLQGPLYSTPVALEGIVVLGTVDGTVTGLNALNGKFIWSVTTGRPVLAEGLIENGTVYIGGGDKGFYKLDIHTGKIIWQFTGVSGLIQGKPVISGPWVLFGAWDTHFYCLDKQSGVLKWKWTNGKPQKLYSPGNIFPVVSGERVYIVAPDRYMTALDINTGRQIWRTGRHQVRESMGISAGGELIYSKLMNDTIIAISATEDRHVTIWASDAGFGYEHNPCPLAATGSQVTAGTRNGVIVAIEPAEGNVIWKYKAGNSSINKIVCDREYTIWLTLMEGKIMGLRTIQNQ